jgi:predicted metal-binding protein
MATKRIGLVICHRYHTCAGGKCFRAFREREGAFSLYQGQDAEIAGYTTCAGCPGGNVESAPEEMKKNGIDVIHLATGLLVGYPPCPYTGHFKKFIEEKYGMQVVIGTHPIPEKYYTTHTKLGTWAGPEWNELLKMVLTDETTRLKYN